MNQQARAKALLAGGALAALALIAAASGEAASVDHNGRPLHDPAHVSLPMAMQSVEPSASPEVSPSVTPLPPPPAPPPDAAGISQTTAPIPDYTPQPSPTLPETRWLTDAATSSVPLALHGGRPFVPVVVDGVRGDFLLSTSEQTTTDVSLAIGGTERAPVVRSLQIGDVRFFNIKVVRQRITPFALTYLGAPAAGILGRDLFASYPVKIDYQNQLLTIYRDEAAATGARSATATAIALQMVAGAPTVPCGVDASAIPACLVDVYSGADIGLWSSASKTDESRRTIGMRYAEPDHEVNGTVERARTMSIGTMTIPGPLLARMSSGETAYEPAGVRAIIGSGALARFAVTIDEPAGKLYLEASPGATPAPSTFDSSGLWLVWRGGNVVVRSVIPKSPADRAGFREGDIVLAIDGVQPASCDAARAAFARPTGTKVKVSYLRGNSRRDVVLTLRSLI